MSEPVVLQVEHLSKRYRLGMVGRTTLYEDIHRWMARLRGRPDPTLRVDQLLRQHASAKPRATEDASLPEDPDHVWALRDVSFSLRKGEVLGIIGPNGSGKSTLLKILSRVTGPTTGSVQYNGRIASLLEVGTGFHRELSGRENIYLNGAILGMSRAEIEAKYDEIVEFSGCGRFIDTPVKRYSSGMYVRLAFAVAAHLEPEILVVDEVLAVGDAEFQKKCLGKMEDVAGHGRTVLFVSHNMGAIQRICSHSIVLREGKMVCGPVPSAEAVHHYLGETRSRKSGPLQFKHGEFTLEDFSIKSLDGQPVAGALRQDQPHCVEISFVLNRYDAGFNIGYVLYNEDGQLLFMSLTTDAEAGQWPPITAGHNRVRSILPPDLLKEGEYQIGLVASYQCAHWLLHPDKDNIRIPFSVSMGPDVSPYWSGRRAGLLAPLLRWERMK